MIDSTLKNGKILIVDDQLANIEVLHDFLEMQGYENIKVTTDSRNVVSLFKDFGPDLILLDLSMPYLNGFEVMEQLKSVVLPTTYLPILVLTADVSMESKQKALSCGASDFLTKPFNLIEVGLRIRNLLYANYLFQQLKNQNQILEEKVKERTYELRKTNEELIIAKDRAEASDRMKTAFIQNISHELRTPLNGILGFGELLADPFISADEKREFIPYLHSSSQRLINNITDYLDISLITAGNMEVKCMDINVNSTLEKIKNEFIDSITAKGLAIKLIKFEGNHEVVINTDPNLFQKIFAHLLNNAVKFTNNGTITVGYSIKGSAIELFVKDTGIGIEKDAQERIFENFMQADYSDIRAHEGNGLGLSIVKGLLKLLGGEIRLESVIGEGSTFFILLPA